MAQFKNSSAKRDLLGFVSTLGRCCSMTSLTLDPSRPLMGLSPGMAALHGALSCIAATWIQDLPPAPRERARFGNPAFRTWHQRLENRSTAIIKAIMNSHLTYLAGVQVQQDTSTSASGVHFDHRILQHCASIGYQAAASDPHGQDTDTAIPASQEETIIQELRAHLHLSFGHPIRLDFGTGHESCFFIFLLCLFKLGIFGYVNKTTSSINHHHPPSPDIMAPVALAIVSQYLNVCRGLQVQYMLEPAGSHGVWGLDDYHCIPFYIGACQLHQQQQQQQQPSNYHHHTLDSMQHLGEIKPSSIHKDEVVQSTASDVYMYLGCIRYVKSLKKGVPFFESSPMLNDISQLQDWIQVSSGLLRLYEGEVLDQFSVVQHFCFGELFKGAFFKKKR